MKVLYLYKSYSLNVRLPNSKRLNIECNKNNQAYLLRLIHCCSDHGNIIQKG